MEYRERRAHLLARAYTTLGFYTREPRTMSDLQQQNLTRVAPKGIVSRSSFYRALQDPPVR